MIETPRISADTSSTDLRSECSVGVAVLTYRSRAHLERCLRPLFRSRSRPRVLVVDSSSCDGTLELASALGAETLSIPREEFNHGGTRNLARQHLGTEVVVMMTPDAYVRDEGALDTLVAPIIAGEATIAYGRQVPRPKAGFFETFPRRFSYPAHGHVRSAADAHVYGAYLTFNSDAFAAYLNSALDEIGGFPTTLSHEDAIVAAMLLQRGHRIAYVAAAEVEHSHRYSIRTDFRRYFDAGYAREEFREAFAIGGSHKGLGGRYARELVSELARSHPWLLPCGAIHLLVRAAGYSLGRRCVGGPAWASRRLSGQRQYWAAGPQTPHASVGPR